MIFLALAAGAFLWLKNFKKSVESSLQEYVEKRNDTNTAKENMADTRARLVKLESSFSLLLESDKCRIRGEIVREYRHFVKQGWIDEISLNYLNKQYEIYHKEGGNSYITGLMTQLNALPIGDMVAPHASGRNQ